MERLARLFPEEFRQGMAARAEMLGDTGAQRARSIGSDGLASPDLHAIVILFARDDAEQDRCVVGAREAHRQLPRRRSVVSCSTFTPFRRLATRTSISAIATGCQSRRSRETGYDPTPGYGRAFESRRVHPWLSGRDGVIADSPRPEILARNGSYMAYRRLEEHVGKFREFLAEHGETRRSRS